MTYEYMGDLHKKLYVEGFSDSELKNMAKNHLKFIPRKKLYRYRPSNPKEMNTLKNNSIWLSDPTTFHDMFDSLVAMESRENIEWYYHLILYFKITYEAYVKVALEYDDEFVSYEEWVEAICKQAKDMDFEKAKEEYGELVKNNFQVDSEVIKHNCKQAEQIAEFLNAVRTYPREKFSIASFTNTYDNRAMWENYASNYTGFCVEYDFKRNFENLSRCELEDILHLLPIKYYKTRPMFDSIYFIEDFIDCKMQNGYLDFDGEFFIAELYKTMLSKRKEYSFENEWRYVLHKQSCGERKFPHISRIILGKDIAEKDEETIYDIAKQLNVEVYKQKVNFELDTMEYVKIKQDM